MDPFQCYVLRKTAYLVLFPTLWISQVTRRRIVFTVLYKYFDLTDDVLFDRKTYEITL